MDIYFNGICTHVAPMSGQPHRVILMASQDYVVDSPEGPITIVPHTPRLTLRKQDILDPEQLPAFTAHGFTPDEAPEGMLAWKLDKVTFNSDALQGGIDIRKADPCLPHLFQGGGEIEEPVRLGDTEQLASATIELHGGTLETVSDGTARHGLLHASFSQPWNLAVRSPERTPRKLTLAADAEVTFSNTANDRTLPCSQNDYLLHYRITARHFVPADQFQLPPECDPPLRDFSYLFEQHPEGDEAATGDRDSSVFTLSNCSNSIYP